MSTRSLTIINGSWKGNDKFYEIAVMYRHMDGYPEGHGKDLAEFLKDFTVVNGMGMGDPIKIANGAQCLDAQIVAYFKDGPGDIYLHSKGTRNCWEDYRYYVYARDGDTIIMKVCDVVLAGKQDYDDINVPLKFREKKLFQGTPQEFLTWLKERKDDYGE